jgi:PAS domain S-box-containing protein
MPAEPVLTAAALAHLQESAAVLALTLDAERRIAAANAYALGVLGADVVGRAFSELVLNLAPTCDWQDLTASRETPRMLSLVTAAGLPETFHFRFFALPEGTLALGHLNLQEQERLRQEVLGLNRELNTLARGLHQANADLQGLNQQLTAEVARRRELESSLEDRVEVRTRELKEANQKLLDARKAALNLMDDATQARKRAAAVNAALQAEVEERRRAEQELRRTQEQLDLAQHSAGAGLWNWDIPGGSLQWSPELFELFGLDPQAAPASFAAWEQVLHPEDRAKAGERIDRAVREHAGLVSEYRIVRPKGEVRWIQAIGGTRYAADGRPLQMSGICLDITARREMEAALLESETRFARIFRSSPLGASLSRLTDGLMLDVNDAYLELFGYTRDELVGRTSLAAQLYVHAEDRAHLLAALRANGRVLGYELEARRKSGEIRTVLLNGETIEIAGERCLLAQCLDITERQHAERQVREALAEKEVLLKEVHHRVKNNLQVVSGLLDLQAERIEESGVRRVLQESQSRIKSIALVHEKLYQSAGLAQLDFRSYVQSLVVHLFRTHQGQRPVARFVLHMPEVALSLPVAVPCGLLINELVSNTLKYAWPAGGAVEANECILTWEDAGAAWRLTVRDNGVGLPPGLDWTSTQTLGLRLVQLLTRQLKGTVRQAGGPGSCFVIEFPKP